MAKNVAKKEATDVIPSWMQDDAGLGTEAIGTDAMEMPRVKLLQALSPELDDNEALRAGMWFHTITEEEYGKELTIIPCYSTLSYILWRPQDDGGGILARADDGVHWSPPDAIFNVRLKGGQEVTWKTAKTVAASRLHLFGTENPEDPASHPAAVAMINVACLCPDMLDTGPFVVTFQRSGHSVGKKFMSNLKMSRIPSFGRMFNLTSVKIDGPSGPYLEPRVKAVGRVEDEELYARCKEMYLIFKQQGLRVKEETMAEDASELSPGDGSEEVTEY